MDLEDGTMLPCSMSNNNKMEEDKFKSLSKFIIQMEIK
jgi:hypothetical protein